jgi:hypothetical protein
VIVFSFLFSTLLFFVPAHFFLPYLLTVKMHSFKSVLFPSLFALAHGHSVILNAQGLDTSPASVGFQGKHDTPSE